MNIFSKMFTNCFRKVNFLYELNQMEEKVFIKMNTGQLFDLIVTSLTRVNH